MGMEGEGGKGKGALPRRRGGGGGRRRCGTPFAGVLTAAAAAAARGERKGHTRDLIWVWSFLFSSGCKSLSPPPLLGFSDLRKGEVAACNYEIWNQNGVGPCALVASASPVRFWSHLPVGGGGGTLPFHYLFFVSLGGDGDFLPTSRRCHVSVFLFFFQLPLVSFNLFDP
jgi:hypothetical protein